MFFDDQGQCLDANPAAGELAGRDLHELASVVIAELLPGEDWAALWPAFHDGRRHTGSCRVRRSDGALCDVDVQVVTEVMPGVHVATLRDVTARRRAEAERDFHAQLSQAAGVAMVATDLDGTVTFWNAAAEQLYGWPRDQALGRSIVELDVAPGATSNADEIMTQVRSGDTWTGEVVVARRDGTAFPALATTAPYVDDAGEVAGIIGVSTDITELRHARERAQLRASRQAVVAWLGRRALAHMDLDELVDEAVKMVAVELDAPLVSVLELTAEGDELLLRAGAGSHRGLVGIATFPNDGGTQQAGYTLAEDDTVIVEDLASDSRFGVPSLLAEHGAVSGVSTPIRGRDRRYGVLSAHTTTPRTFTDDDVVFLDAVAAVLGGAIARDGIETELQATVDRLQRSEEIRVAFLRATSHELRTPLSAVSGFAETLEEHDAELEPEQRRVVLGRLRANTGRLSQLIEDLLDVDRLASGMVTANRQLHDLRELVHRVVDQQELAGRLLELDLDPVQAHVDPPKLERVVANLLANAVRHTPAGATIRIGLRRDADATVLSVEDDGRGIDPDYLDQIFDPFVQDPKLHDAPQPGTGLGLTLAREFVTLHGGRITAANRTEGGVRFVVVLPDLTDDDLN